MLKIVESWCRYGNTKNEYVRTDNGQIFKVLEVEKGSVKIKSDYREWIGICCIQKHSFNIIDLIEPGDLVEVFEEENIDENGTTEDTCVYEVTATQVKDFYGNKTNEIGITGDEGVELIPFANVRSVVTKEQFESIKYEV